MVDEILRKYSKLANSYIKDTGHFLQEIQQIPIQPGDILATVNVTALYMNIPHQDGIEKTRRFLSKHGASQAEITLTETLLGHILKKNYFQFNNEHYLQVSGTAMGTRCAPNYAIIFMAELEEEFLATIDKKPKIWRRLIDDIFMIWNLGELELTKLLEELNKFQQSNSLKNIVSMEFHFCTLSPILRTTNYKPEFITNQQIISNIFTTHHVTHFNRKMLSHMDF